MAGLSRDQLETRYRPGGWTVKQVVHHVPDSHMNAYVRFKLGLTEDEPTIKPYDEAAWAELPDSHKCDRCRLDCSTRSRTLGYMLRSWNQRFAPRSEAAGTVGLSLLGSCGV